MRIERSAISIASETPTVTKISETGSYSGPKKEAQYLEISFRSERRPRLSVYDVFPCSRANMDASLIFQGVTKSGSQIPKEIAWGISDTIAKKSRIPERGKLLI